MRTHLYVGDWMRLKRKTVPHSDETTLQQPQFWVHHPDSFGNVLWHFQSGNENMVWAKSCLSNKLVPMRKFCCLHHQNPGSKEVGDGVAKTRIMPGLLGSKCPPLTLSPVAYIPMYMISCSSCCTWCRVADDVRGQRHIICTRVYTLFSLCLP